MDKFLDKAAEAYYDGEPIMTDAEWDYLAEIHHYNKLGVAVYGAIKHKHAHRLYSLQKFYETDKLPFMDGIETPKLDGSAISLTYVQGKLVTAATRGDGIEGEDVTNNFKAWSRIPLHIPITGLVQIVGEIVAPKEIKNSRNYAAGAARLKTSTEFLSRDIHFITYTLHKEIPNPTYADDMSELQKLGFCTVLYATRNLVAMCPTDGKVYRLNSNKAYQEMGFTDKHPRGAFALKNSTDVACVHTELLEVIWQVGKSGKVTPVAIFKEIEIDDAKINRATLHNAGFVENLELCLGDTIIVTRAGGIIPRVLGVA